jgi:hypothetical protein
MIPTEWHRDNDRDRDNDGDMAPPAGSGRTSASQWQALVLLVIGRVSNQKGLRVTG